MKNINKFKKLKIIGSIFVLLLISCNERSKTIKNIEPFTLSITTFNYANRLLEGELNYTLTENKLEISNKTTIGGHILILKSKKLIPSNTLFELSKLNLDTLDDFYENPLIPPTSGNVIFFEFSKNKKTKSIFAHSYYHNHLGQIIQNLNKLIDDKYKILYDSNSLYMPPISFR